MEIEVNYFCVVIFHVRVQRTNEMYLNKNNEPDLQTRIHHELVLIFYAVLLLF